LAKPKDLKELTSAKPVIQVEPELNSIPLPKVTTVGHKQVPVAVEPPKIADWNTEPEDEDMEKEKEEEGDPPVVRPKQIRPSNISETDSRLLDEDDVSLSFYSKINPSKNNAKNLPGSKVCKLWPTQKPGSQILARIIKNS